MHAIQLSHNLYKYGDEKQANSNTCMPYLKVLLPEHTNTTLHTNYNFGPIKHRQFYN